MRTLFQTIKQQFLEGNDLVLASITASSGSTPRGAGSRMLIGKSGRIAGTIGGGAVEYRAELMIRLFQRLQKLPQNHTRNERISG